MTESAAMPEFDHRRWLRDFCARLTASFGERLLFVGLQGSYRRGEAHRDSDLDVVVILDRLDCRDLEAYRALTDAMPHADKACGFIGGREELRNWPRHELFQFSRDTEALHGDLDSLLPPITRRDIIEGVRVGVSALYHMLAHTRVHGPAQPETEALRAACKSAFFILQSMHFLRTGRYVGSRSGLLGELSGKDWMILAGGVDWRAGGERAASDPDELFALIFEWCGETLRTSWEKDGGHGEK